MKNRKVLQFKRIKRIFLHIEEGRSRPEACHLEGMPLGTLRGWIIRSRNGQAPAWISEQWDRLQDLIICDLCGANYRRGMGVGREESYRGANIYLSFCSPECAQKWDEQETEY